mgnify:CR=1 FL=1|jgi:hypothetical protein
MANNKAAPGPAPEPKQTDKAPEFFDIGELRSKHKIGWAVFAGVCAAKEWKPGKAVTEEEFLAAVREFNAAPMTGARKESEAKK